MAGSGWDRKQIDRRHELIERQRRSWRDAQAGSSSRQDPPPQNLWATVRPHSGPSSGGGLHSDALSDDEFEEAEALHGFARDAIIVLQLKNAITHLTDVVYLYASVNSGIGPRPIWEAFADTHSKDIQNAIHRTQRGASEVRKTRHVEKEGFVEYILEISSDVDDLWRSWEKARNGERQERRYNDTEAERQQRQRSRAVLFLNELKKILRPWKKQGSTGAQKWFRSAETRLADMRDSMATFGTGNEQAFYSRY